MIMLSLFSPETEAVIGLALVVVSVVAAGYAFKVARLFGGALGKTWTLLSWVAILYALFQIMLSLEEFHVIEFGGIDELIEILITLALFFAFYQGYKTLKKQGA